MKGKRLTLDQKSIIMRLLESGKTRAEISEFTEISYSSVCNTINQYKGNYYQPHKAPVSVQDELDIQTDDFEKRIAQSVTEAVNESLSGNLSAVQLRQENDMLKSKVKTIKDDYHETLDIILKAIGIISEGVATFEDRCRDRRADGVPVVMDMANGNIRKGDRL